MIAVPKEKCFHSVNVKRNWEHSAGKNSRPGAKVIRIFMLSWKYFNHIIIKTF